MTSASVEPRPWSLLQWAEMVVLIFVVQLGLIFWLGSPVPIRPRPAAAALTLHLATPASAELRALYDPTLFTLPHPQGFSGPAWQQVTQQEFHPFEWPAPTNRLPLAFDRLGAIFSRLIESNQFGALQLPLQPEASPTLPDLPPLSLMADQSVVQLEDGLARRRLLAPLHLRSCTNADILADSVVQVVVDAEGLPVWVTLLSGSGSADADQFALEQARAARFDPLSRNPAESNLNPLSRLTWGRMSFRWHTIPVPPPSAPAAKPVSPRQTKG
jgi:TonB family protein